LVFTKDLIDRAIVAKLSKPKEPRQNDVSHFEYLINCYEASYSEERHVIGLKDAEQRQAVLKQVREFAISYAGLVVQMPDMFAAESNVSASQILAERILEDRIYPEFLADLVQRFAEDGLEGIFNGVLLFLSNNMRQQSLSKSYSFPIRALTQLVAFKPIASLAVNLSSWCPKKISAREFELISFLGPFFRPSASIEDDPAIGDQYFGNPSRLTQADVNASVTAIRTTLHNYQGGLHAVVKSILTSGPENREKMLQFVTEAIVKNEKRAQMQVDPKQVSSDGFMMNLVAVCLRLCEPFVAPGAQKIPLVDKEYPLKSTRYNITKETRLRATSDEIETWQKENLNENVIKGYSPNFITECFFLTSQVLHLGLQKGFSKYQSILKDLREIQKAQKRMEQAPQSPQTDMFLQRIKQQLEIYVKAKFCYDVQLLDPEVIGSAFKYYSFVCLYLMAVADPENKGMPLPKNAPLTFKVLPEYLVEDTTEFFLFLAKYSPESLHLSNLQPVISFIVAFMANPDYIKSPHLRSKFAEFLYMITPEVQAHSRTQSLEFLFYSTPLVLNNLTKVLMDFYQEVENTGSSHQFYEKFNVRYHISMILKLVWENPTHRERIREESNNDSFIRFVNLLLNDTTYLLDESLTLLPEIRNFQEKQKDERAWNALTEDERKEQERNHQQNERRCQSLLFLAKETLVMLRYLTSDIPQPFLKPQIIDRLVAMLNYNVAQLVGPKCQELKVQDPEKYGFNPKELLSIIVGIYPHLAHPTFIEAMAREGRSYNKSHFDKACGIFRRFGLKSLEEIEALEKMVKEVEETKQRELEQEQELGDVPDEYLDPITYTPMSNPVLLPTSGVIVDRSTIETHLLSDTVDPFNRKPLSIDMVQPVPELKEKIDKFFSKKK